MKCFVNWTSDLKSSKLWSSQLWTQIKQLRIEVWKSQDFNGVWTRDLAIRLLYVRNCLNCVHNCDDHSLLDFKSAFQYMKHFIYHFTSILQGLIRAHKWQAPNVSGLIAQLIRASHRYREVTASNPVEVLSFSGFYTQLLKLRSQLRWS